MHPPVESKSRERPSREANSRQKNRVYFLFGCATSADEAFHDPMNGPVGSRFQMGESADEVLMIRPALESASRCPPRVESRDGQKTVNRPRVRESRPLPGYLCGKAASRRGVWFASLCRTAYQATGWLYQIRHPWDPRSTCPQRSEDYGLDRVACTGRTFRVAQAKSLRSFLTISTACP